MESFEEYCKDFIRENLNIIEGRTVYASELGLTLTNWMNLDGTATYDRAQAIEYIKEWWYEAADVYDYIKFSCGEVFQNPFDNPEAWMVIMITEGINSLLFECEIIQENWNEEILLTEEIISKINEELEDKTISF